MVNEDIAEKLAQLEFQNDQLVAELEYVDSLLRTIGFADGLASVKAAAKELAEYNHLEERRFEDGLPDEPPGFE